MKYLYILSLLCSCLLAQAQLDTFNINTKIFNNISSEPEMLVTDGQDLYFVAANDTFGRELWVMKAGASFPRRVTDIQLGQKDGIDKGTKTVALFNNKVYFAAQNVDGNMELWEHNPVTDQQRIVADIFTGNTGSWPGYLTPMGNRLYFTANGNNIGYELWAYDAIGDSVTLIKDIHKGYKSSFPSFLYVFNNKLYFGADDGKGAGNELHVYDPVADTVILIADIWPGQQSGFYGNFVTLNQKLYFNANDNKYGIELWEYTGTGQPKRITDFDGNSGSGIQNNANNTIYKGWLYTDGVNYNTQRYELCAFEPSTNTSYFFATNNVTSSKVQYLCVYNGRLYFKAADTTHGHELWSFDGNKAPVLVVDILPGSNSSWCHDMIVADGYLYFAADLGGDIGVELFRYNDKTLGLSRIRKNISITTYPNPAKGDFTIDLGDNYYNDITIQILNTQGQLVYRQVYHKHNKKIAVSLANQPLGIYNVLVDADDAHITQNVVILQ